MFGQQIYTVVIVTFDTISRVDLSNDAAPQVLHSARIDRSQQDLTDAVHAGMTLLPDPCGDVFVLTDEIWSGFVPMDPQITDELDDDQIDQALAFEAESESGISPFEATVAHVLQTTATNKSTWWVTLSESGQLSFDQSPTAKTVVRGYASTSIATDGQSMRTGDTSSSESCIEFSREWLERFLTDKDCIPIIWGTRKTFAESHGTKVRILIAAATLFICCTFQLHANRQLSDARDKHSSLVAIEKRLRSKIDAAEKAERGLREVATLKEQHRQELRKQSAKRAALQREHEQRRKRPTQILEALANTASDNHLIQEIHLTDQEVVVTGIATSVAAATDLASHIDATLDAVHWTVYPITFSKDSSPHLIEFELHIAPALIRSSHLAVGKNNAADTR